MTISLPVQFPEALPLTQKLDEIKAAISAHQVIIVGGETGSGKTTQLPKICIDLGRGQDGMIGHTQPRRLAARTVSQRIADELQVSLGQEVGYQVRFNDHSSPATQIKLMTDGILLAEIQQDPELKAYDTIIIDEAHERSLNIDFLLGYLKGLLDKRPDLKLIITSATIDLDKFSRHFDGAPIVEVSGRTFPVDIHYQPIAEEDDQELAESIIKAVRELLRMERSESHKSGDVLVFLSGEREIRDVAQALRKARLGNTEVLPLYARLGNKEQNRVFQPHAGRRIVLATNVAETSITVPGITCVIDPGTARMSRYSVRSKVQRLPIEAISKASANQRAGRCGRIAPGICIRLYSEEDFQSRPDFTDTEITRTNLASVILQMHALGLGDIASFPFIDKPENKAINDGLKLLQEIGAVNQDNQLSKAGRLMARLPVDPRFARMLLDAGSRNCLAELLIIVSAMSIQDPRERPMDRQQAADEKHRQFEHPGSDFLGFIKLWTVYEEQRQSCTRNQLRKYCQKHFLSFMRMREWREIHRQLHLQCRELSLKENRQPGDEDSIHQALLSGLISQVARRHEDSEYLGTRNRKFQVSPGSVLFKKKTKWLLSAELVETSRLYARLNAGIKAEWIEAAAGELLKHEYLEPHWEKKRGEIMAYEKVTLYGLTLVERRKVSFSKIDPALSRELFIRQALVPLDIDTRLDFYQHNRKLIEQITELEDKTRRRDILIDDDSLFEFYDTRLTEQICSQKQLEAWYKKLDREAAASLLLTEADLTRNDTQKLNLDEFPDQLSTPTMALKLAYEFSPGKSDDGVSVDVPVSALQQLSREDLDWLVPGMLREKCIALVKALPKNLRKHFVPVPDVIERLLPAIREKKEGSLQHILAKALTSVAGVRIDPALWRNYSLESHLHMNIRVLDEQGNLLDSSRDLHKLQDKYAEIAQQHLQVHAESSIERRGITEWDFGELALTHEIKHGDIRLTAYPALLDEEDSVALTLCDTASLAATETRWGIVRLLMLKSRSQVKYLQKNLLKNPQLLLLLSHFGSREEVLGQLIRASFRHAFLHSDSLPKNADEFDRLYDAGRAKLVSKAESLEKELGQIMQLYHELLQQLDSLNLAKGSELREDIALQLDELLHADFICDTPEQYYFELVRYLQAVSQRLEKYPRQPEKDQQWTEVLQTFYADYLQEYENLVSQNRVSSELENFRWMLEEFRVSVFAQNLGTRYPISEKRLRKFWQEKIIGNQF